MRIRLSVLTATLIFVALSSQAFQNEPAGFRGLVWGADLAPLLGELSLLEESGTTKVFTRPADKLTIGAANVKRIVYLFESDRLTSVMIESEGLPDNTALLEAFSAQFGTPSKPNRFMDKYNWKGKLTTITYTCTLTLNADCMAYLVSSASLSNDKEERARKAKSSSEDF